LSCPAEVVGAVSSLSVVDTPVVAGNLLIPTKSLCNQAEYIVDDVLALVSDAKDDDTSVALDATPLAAGKSLLLKQF
jgi:hypothetical protein